MGKTIFYFLMIILLTSRESVRSQSNSDSITSGSDSLQTIGYSSVSEDENSDSLLLPVSDSIYMPVEKMREVPEKQLSKYLNDATYAYANDPEYWKKQAPPKPGKINQFLNSPVFRWMIFLGIMGVVSFGINQLARENNFTWFSRNKKQDNTLSPEFATAEETDFESAIRKYHTEGNYRMAVRYLYLRLIYTAREKGKVSFRDSSTNSEIAIAFENYVYAGDFRYLARAYEYIYYGDFKPQADLFDMLKNKFEVFQQKISN